MALNNVDLPDPFGPITATTPPLALEVDLVQRRQAAKRTVTS